MRSSCVAEKPNSETHYCSSSARSHIVASPSRNTLLKKEVKVVPSVIYSGLKRWLLVQEIKGMFQCFYSSPIVLVSRAEFTGQSTFEIDLLAF